MTSGRSIRAAGLGALMLCAGTAAYAQEAANSAAPAPAIGPPQLRDFQLQPQRRIVTQPTPSPSEQQPPAEASRERPQPAAERPAPQRSAPAEARRTPEPAVGPGDSAVAPAPAFEFPEGAVGPEQPAPADRAEAAPAPAPPAGSGSSWWLYGIPAAALAFVGVAAVRRRRRRGDRRSAAAAAEADKPKAKPLPPPAPRPWLELELKAERASFGESEAVVQFELAIRNTGKASARNLRVDVKMFNAGREQDKAIGAFFRTAGRESTKLQLPGIRAGSEGVIRGEVAMPREEMRAVRLDDRMLFIPVVAVNTLYDYGEEGRTGQTSRSYVIGREVQEDADKMGPFRVDQGPRVWRSVGQRPHKVARRA